MKKSTRHAFSRRAVMLAVSLFVTVALITTGFAAWLITSDSSDEGSGNISAAVVDDARLGIEINNDTNLGNISFGPQKTDTESSKTNHIRYKAPVEGENDDCEQLEVVVTGKIEKADQLSKIEITVAVTDDVLRAAGYSWVDGAEAGSRTYTYTADNARISLPYYATDSAGKFLPKVSESAPENTAWVISGTDTEVFADAEAEGAKTFKFTVKFGWGAKYANENPGRYLDGQVSGKTPSVEWTLDQKKTEMEALKSSFSESTKFTVKVKAVAK